MNSNWVYWLCVHSAKIDAINQIGIRRSVFVFNERARRPLRSKKNKQKMRALYYKHQAQGRFT